MTNPVNPINSLQNIKPQLDGLNSLPIESGKESGTFQNLLIDSIGHVNQLEQASQENLAGGEITQVEVFSVVKKADLALHMMVQVRNKLMQSYNEIKQMQM